MKNLSYYFYIFASIIIFMAISLFLYSKNTGIRNLSQKNEDKPIASSMIESVSSSSIKSDITTVASDTNSAISPVYIIGPNDPVPKIDCPEGQILVGLIDHTEKKISCAIDKSFDEFFVGTGKEIYSVTGYYKQYEDEFYGEDPELHIPKIFQCKGFIITGGSENFIKEYSKKMPLKIDGYPVINLDHMKIRSGNKYIDEALPDQIYKSTQNNQSTFNIGSGPLTGRGVNPCENFEIYYSKKE